MMNLRADGGRPLGIKPTAPVAPPTLEAAALALLNTETISGGESYVWHNTVELIVTPFLAA